MLPKLLDLIFKMLRFRTALLLLLFVALADASTKAVATNYNPELLLVLVVLAGWYIFSTSVNDLADYEIDKVNLKGFKERPLANNLISKEKLCVLAFASSFIVIVSSYFISGPKTVLFSVAALLLSYTYSFPPVRISARGIIAPLMLPIGYVLFPFGLVFAANQATLNLSFVLLTFAIFFSFSGRIILKDFRDVKGDKMFGKKTFVIRHGRKATVYTSMILWTVGFVFIVLRFSNNPLAVLSVSFMVLAIFLSLAELGLQGKLVNQLKYVGLVGRLANGSALIILIALYSEISFENEFLYTLLIPLMLIFNFATSWALYENEMRSLLSKINKSLQKTKS